jgi:hypothetical protein
MLALSDEVQWKRISKLTGRGYDLMDPNNVERKVLECLIESGPRYTNIDKITKKLWDHGNRITRIVWDWIEYLDYKPSRSKNCYLYKLNSSWSRLVEITKSI